jgi:hypothetical protein
MREPIMPIAPQDRAALVSLARQAVAHAMGAGPRPIASYDGILGEPLGCFVTLTNKGALRGCIGTFHPRGPLADMVVEMGQAAARDPRFIYYRHITAGELPKLTIEVSVLSKLEPIADPLSLQIGKHGIYILRGGAGGCFLPEVATDQGWDAQEFLTQCCSGKAGLAPDAWKDKSTQVFVFTSEKFCE